MHPSFHSSIHPPTPSSMHACIHSSIYVLLNHLRVSSAHNCLHIIEYLNIFLKIRMLCYITTVPLVI
jgi:hypothetical protein